tara:strand:+ start:2151 stop:2618 length:468 start_codon:yes stop_codon:yes gene_type:complete
MFKRKEAMPPRVGSICMIKREVAETLNATNYYKKYSASLASANTGYSISNSIFGKQAGRKKTLFADCILLLVTKESNIKGLVNVVPIAVNNDNRNAIAVRRHNNDASINPFTVSLDSLSLASSGHISSALDELYFSSTKDYINEVLRRNDCNLRF